MKSVKLLAACIFIIGIVGCIPAEDKLVVRSCEAFDFGIQETNWILFPQGRDYSFRSGDQTFELISEYQITEPYILEYERPAIFAFFPDGIARNCYSSFGSTHYTKDQSLKIYNSIGYSNPEEKITINIFLDRMSFELLMVNDTLTGSRTRHSKDDFEEYQYKNFSSLSLDGKQYNQVLRVSQSNPNVQPQEIYLAKSLGLVAFVKNDSLWVRE
ncbi:MAG: hypothetical protein PSV36_05145 [Algoriphagus sp.]|nr:hypothetical protein [Algoriphagus sp.]